MGCRGKPGSYESIVGPPRAACLKDMATAKKRTANDSRGKDDGRGEAALQGTFAWDALVPVAIHPTKVAIVQAMMWLKMPVSARDVQWMFEEPEQESVSVISYHMRTLAELGAVEKTGCRSVRGAEQTFYFLSPSMTTGMGGSGR